MDTSLLEHVAEDLASYSLQQQGLLVAKPKNDQKGTDLLVFKEVKDGVKFCRVQCKGRSVVRGNSHIEIPKCYVTDGFVVLLYVQSERCKGNLYFFTPNHVRSWSENDQNEYCLGISRKHHESKLADFLFDESSINTIEATIELAELHNEFKRLIHAKLNATLDDVTTASKPT